MLFIKTRQKHIYRGVIMDLNSSSTEVVLIKNYKIQIFRYDFTCIYVYLCRVSFLTTLDIYKDYLRAIKGMQGDATWCKMIIYAYCDRSQFALVHHILSWSYCVFTPRVLWPRSFLIFIVRWTKKLCSQHFSQVGVLVTYWDPCIIG